MFEIIISLLLLFLGAGGQPSSVASDLPSTSLVAFDPKLINDYLVDTGNPNNETRPAERNDGGGEESSDTCLHDSHEESEAVSTSKGKGQEKVSAYNESSGKIINKVAKIATEKSPVLTPSATEPDLVIVLPPSPTPIKVPKPIPSIIPIPIPIIVIPIPDLPKDPCPPIMVPPPGYKLELPERMPCMY